MMDEDRDHSRCSPSGASRWATCPGSTRLGEQFPKPPESPYAAEGTRAHELLERCLRERRYPQENEGDDAEMRLGVTLAVDYVLNLVKTDGVVFVEDRLPCTYSETDFGHVDIVVCVGGVMHVIDFKYGAGIYVDVRDNKQLLAYGGGALARHGADLADTVRLTIIQPRVGDVPVRWWDRTVAQVMKANARLAEARKLVDQLDAVPLEMLELYLAPSEEGCRWCNARARCPALLRQAENAAKVAFSKVTLNEPPVLGTSNDELAAIYRNAKLIRFWLRAVEEAVVNELRAGRRVEGFKLVQKKPQRQWAEADPAILAALCSNLSGGALAASEFLRQPQQIALDDAKSKLKKAASDAAPKGAKRSASRDVAEQFDQLLTDKKPNTVHEVAPETDDRPAVNRIALRYEGEVT